MDPIGGEVRRELRRFGPPEGAGMAELVRAWPAAVGPEVARNAWPARLSRDGTLHVATSSAAWAFELGRLSADLAARLRETLGEVAPAKLRFAPGPLPETVPGAEPEAGPEPVAATPADAALGAELASPIEDGELRELVARAAAASLARARSGRPL